ncbi:MAG: hypothetical protein IT305_11015 [Chloroflexi bacterium]|nr:hypothetical protein [Chloroflexota bacterium]
MQVRNRVTQDGDGVPVDSTVAEALKIARAHRGEPVTVYDGNNPVGVVAEDETSVPPATRIFLQPIAAPSILGLFGFAGATFMVATQMAGWYSNPSALFIFPFAAFFGGLAQFMAGMWAFRARDAVATAMHGTWGSFWMAYGLLNLLFATGNLTAPNGVFPEFGFWFIVLAAVTWAGTVAAIPENSFLTGVLGFLAGGSTVAAIWLLTGIAVIGVIAGWLFIVSAVIAWYLASIMMIAAAYKREVLPLGNHGRGIAHPVQYTYGQPGVKVGQ